MPAHLLFQSQGGGDVGFGLRSWSSRVREVAGLVGLGGARGGASSRDSTSRAAFWAGRAIREKAEAAAD